MGALRLSPVPRLLVLQDGIPWRLAATLKPKTDTGTAV